MIYTLFSTAINSSETIEHLTGSGLFGIFVLLLLIVGMEKWVSYQSQKDRLKMEEARVERTDNKLIESRKMESESRDKLAAALNGVAEMTKINGIKIDELTDDVREIGDKVQEHDTKIAKLEEKDKDRV